MKKFAPLLVCGLVFACAPTLSGKLTDPKGAEIADRNARVNVSRLDGDAKDSESLVVPVDQQGTFTIDKDLPEGSYLLEAIVPGYEVASKNVDVEGRQRVTLTLKRLPRPETTPIEADDNPNANRGQGGASLAPPNL